MATFKVRVLDNVEHVSEASILDHLNGFTLEMDVPFKKRTSQVQVQFTKVRREGKG